jgi:alpha-beta hydrolase superfamily lysophospholipase
MFAGARAVADPERLAAMRKDLPLYLVVGEMDPVNGQLALLRELARRYEEAGLRDVTVVTYPGARHEVFNEINRDEVVAGILAWLDRELPV